MVDLPLIENTRKDFEGMIGHYILGERKGFFLEDTDDVKPLGDAFNIIKGWLDGVYGG